MAAREEGTGDLFAALPTHDAPAMSRLHARLVAGAERAGTLDIAYRTVETPVGPLLLAATGRGLVKIGYEVQNHERILEQLADEISPRVLEAPERLEEASRQIEEYFDGRRTRFELPLDRRLSKGFRREVLARLDEIGYGCTASYGEIAAAAGSPRAVRAVGTACAKNPLPIVVPCHRVVRSDGSPGGYAGGADAKHTLLGLEHAA